MHLRLPHIIFIIAIVFLLFGTAEAFEPLAPDDVVVVAKNGDVDSAEVMTFEELEAMISEDDPARFTWCEWKGNAARGILSDRGELSQNEILEVFTELKDKMPRHFWLEIERMINETHRVNQDGSFITEKSNDNFLYLKQKEYQSCLVNGF